MSAKRKEIKRRMKSIANTKKMTKAMEMTAAAKMRKAQLATLASRAFSDKSWQLFMNISASLEDVSHPLLTPYDQVTDICIMHIVSDKGLCGSLNTQMNKKTAQFIQKQKEKGRNIHLITIGKKGAQFFTRQQIHILDSYPNWSSLSVIEHVLPLSSQLQKGFLLNQYQEVYVAYTDFKSTLTQIPRIKQILPFLPYPDKELGSVSDFDTATSSSQNAQYIFEPSAKNVLHELIPSLVESQIYQAFLESQASEHSARMVAMKNATESASELIDQLKLRFNKARQTAITQEIIEIMSAQSAIK